MQNPRSSRSGSTSPSRAESLAGLGFVVGVYRYQLEIIATNLEKEHDFDPASIHQHGSFFSQSLERQKGRTQEIYKLNGTRDSDPETVDRIDGIFVKAEKEWEENLNPLNQRLKGEREEEKKSVLRERGEVVRGLAQQSMEVCGKLQSQLQAEKPIKITVPQGGHPPEDPFWQLLERLARRLAILSGFKRKLDHHWGGWPVIRIDRKSRSRPAAAKKRVSR